MIKTCFLSFFPLFFRFFQLRWFSRFSKPFLLSMLLLNLSILLAGAYDYDDNQAKEAILSVQSLIALAYSSCSSSEELDSIRGDIATAEALVNTARLARFRGDYNLACASALKAISNLKERLQEKAKREKAGTYSLPLSINNIRGKPRVKKAGGRTFLLWMDDENYFNLSFFCAPGYKNRFQGTIISDGLIFCEKKPPHSHNQKDKALGGVRAETGNRIIFDSEIEGGDLGIIRLKAHDDCNWISFDLVVDGKRRTDLIRMGKDATMPRKVPIFFRFL